jgi:hypothetical protein
VPGSRGSIVVVQVEVVKIYVAAMESLRKKKAGETQRPSKVMVF